MICGGFIRWSYVIVVGGILSLFAYGLQCVVAARGDVFGCA